MERTSGLSSGQRSIYDKFKNISKGKCFKCSASTLPAAYGDQESDYKAVEKTGVLKYGGRNNSGKNYYCSACGVFV